MSGKLKKKEFKFYHKNNNRFTGYILKETDGFYTIKLTSAVAGLNGIWNKGSEVMWSKELTTILGEVKKVSGSKTV
jgi:hypothetical protein